MQEEQIILGVDPGTTIMGFGLIAITQKSMRLIQMHDRLGVGTEIQKTLI